MSKRKERFSCSEDALDFLKAHKVKVMLKNHKDGTSSGMIHQTPVSLRILSARDYLINHCKGFTLSAV